MKTSSWIKTGLLCSLGACIFVGCGLNTASGGTGCMALGQFPALPSAYVSYDNISTHDPGSALYDDDCIKCHGDRLNEVALDGVTPAFHSTMKTAITVSGNDRCKSCHMSRPNFINHSAAGVRTQVNREAWCALCHGPESEVPLYLTPGY